MPIVVEQFVLELDTSIKVGGGACFTIGGTRQVPVVVRTFALGVGENAKESDVSSTLRVKEPYGGAKP